MIIGKLKWLISALAISLAIVLALSITLICTKHTHEFSQLHATAEEHYMVCPDDEAIDESTRGGHTKVFKYDPQNHWYYCKGEINGEKCIWESERTPHNFNANGVCECGYHRT